MSRLAAWLLACCGLAGSGAGAAELQVRVVDSDLGTPVADAVVALTAHGTAAPARSATVARTIDQRDETFIPYVELFRPGDSVVFHNSDPTRHHAYSFSPLGAFSVVLSPGETSSAQRLDLPGVIAVGCNIHDRMITYLFVAATPWMARSGNDGSVRLRDVPAGSYTMAVWHPQLRDPQAAPRRRIALADAAPTVLELPLGLLPDPRRAADPERSDY